MDTDTPEPAALVKAAVQSLDALVLQRKPADVLAEAQLAAAALMDVMAAKPNKVILGGEQYLENEDWLTIGHFYGVTAQIERDEYVTFGDVHGWEATAILVARDGRVLGRATAMCLDDEEKWRARAKKEWAYCLGAESDHSQHGHSVDEPEQIHWEPNPNKPGKNRPRRWRIETGLEAVPLFQLRSMAQTRASSRVHASVLRFVPVLAGFKATPAEEMPDAERVSITGATLTVPFPSGVAMPPIEGDVQEVAPGLHVAPKSSSVFQTPVSPGLHLLTNHRMEGGFDTWTVPNWDSEGGSLQVSTKLKHVITAASIACLERRPVKLRVSMRKDRKGAAYLNGVSEDDPQVPADEIF